MEDVSATSATSQTQITGPVLSEQQKRDFCAELLHRYGLQLNLNNELLPMLYLAYQAAVISQTTSQQTSENLAHILRELDRKVARESNQAKASIHIKGTRQAFWLGFGSIGFPLMAVAILGIVAWFAYQYRMTVQEKSDYIEYLVEHATMQEQAVNDTTSVIFIKLYPSAGFQNARAGSNYVYNSQDQCVQIPLYFKRRE